MRDAFMRVLKSDKAKSPAFWAGIVGSAKLATDAMGLQLITNEQLNAIANGLAAIGAVIGVIASHLPRDKTESVE